MKIRLDTLKTLRDTLNSLSEDQLSFGTGICIASDDDKEGEFYGNNVNPNETPQVYLMVDEESPLDDGQPFIRLEL